MGAVTTLVATVAAAAGAVALYRFMGRQARDFKDALRDSTKSANDVVLDYERDPESGVYKPRH